MLRDWFMLCTAAGFAAYKFETLQLYTLSQKIISDKWLTDRCVPFVHSGILEKGTRARILKGCSQLELQALRERVTH